MIKPWETITIPWDFKVDDGLGFRIYTDGSKYLGKVGCGPLSLDRDEVLQETSLRLNDETTVFMADVYGLFSQVASLRNETTNISTD
ncbi:hypothetical protein AVEN_25856-1 [Araneus ventricosus]|uniref:RNase H type-1 domain-containing protein n=1 Tax=Araneus ventricosus TaxID=182803 RepID=A0A4Y2MBT9_ARAVE|nr:hypothetical protein AVEN_25856-1 [Araneus ventricosus]